MQLSSDSTVPTEAGSAAILKSKAQAGRGPEDEAFAEPTGKTMQTWQRRDWLIFLIALSGWAGFLGTGLGVLSIRDRVREAERYVAQTEAEIETLRMRLQTTQRLSDEMFEASQKLNRQREQIIRGLHEKIRDLEARLAKYEPVPRTEETPP